MNLAKKFSLLIGMLLIIALLILGFIATSLSTTAILKETEKAMIKYSKECANRTGLVLSENLDVLQVVADETELKSMDITVQKTMLEKEIEHLGYLDMAIVTKDGIAYYVLSDETAQLGDREYIQEALNGKANVSEVIISRVTGEPVIMEAVPIKNGNQILGVLIGRRDGKQVGAELSIDKEEGYVFVLGSDGIVYIHPDNQMVKDKRNVFSEIKTNGELKEFGIELNKLGLGKSGILHYSLNGDERITAMAPIPNTNWTLGVGNYENTVLKSIIYLRSLIFVVALIIIVIGVAVVMVIGKVMKIAEEKNNVLKQQLEKKVVQRTAELQQMNKALEEKVHEEVQMQERLQRYQLLAENTNDVMFFVDMEGNILEANNAATRVYGYSHDEFLLMNICDLRHLAQFSYSMEELDFKYIDGEIFETVHYLKNGAAIYVEVSLQGAFLKDEKVFLSIVRNITQRKKTEEKILYLSYHDQLTGIYNRRFYEGELKKIDIKENLPISVAMGDVNGLKLINDTFGHAAGDELIKKVAQVMKKSCRVDDIIARLGGDEFILLLPKTDSSETEKIVRRIKHLALNEKVGLMDISISFGYETKNNENEDIREVIKKAEKYMYKKKLFEGQNMKGNTINAIMDTLHKNNKREELHSSRVANMCEKMGTVLGLSEDEIMELKTVGLLHDIGKIAIDDNVLHSTKKLSDYQWKEIKRHSEIGYRILCTANGMSDLAEYVLFHHERWDGKGYPKGLKGETIPLMSRIVAIIDSYDAMISERSYRHALSEKAALEELQKNAGTQFDSKLISIFIEKVLEKRELPLL
ncbi:diguanylate cyclase [Aminipila sp.]|uniref:diguanylate cyclase n=1 Tax=Aminipila sp. TaxID=2060095 RepID=UPI0028980305|nr:HD domain-containing phosphohydrolase [Aminipila sp.]